MHPLRWLATHDRGYAALRRAGRTAIVMPAMFALGDKVFDNPTLATFAAFGSFAMLLLVDFGGPMRDRLMAQAGLVVVGALFIGIGSLTSRNPWVAAASMGVVGFGVLFSGVVSSVLAGASTSLLLAFILAVTLPGPTSGIPDRLAGWGLAGVVGWLAVALLWPAPAREPLRAPAAAACRALAARIRAEMTYHLSDDDRPDPVAHDQAVADADAAMAALQQVFIATPWRPTGLSTAARSVVRLVDELRWLNTIVVHAAHPPGYVVNPDVRAVKESAAEMLERGAELLADPSGDPAALAATAAVQREALSQLETRATVILPTKELITSYEPTFRAQELSYAVTQIAGNIALAAAAERRTWLERVLGRQPRGVASTLSAAQERAVAHVERHSVWLHNSIRAAIGLALAVLVADESGVQHSFWVVLGTLSVLRSKALNTGSNVLRGLLGTIVGFAIGALLLAAIGTDTTVLWAILPFAILVAGVAPAAISFAAGQAAFTLTIVILFNIIQPVGWRVGLLRIEDVAIGCAVSLVVGLLFWPRGAAAALSRAIAEAYVDSARYVSRAVDFGVARCAGSQPGSLPPRPPDEEATRAAAASRRLDDTFRSYLAEGGSKPIPLAQVSGLVTGVVGLRLAGDAVLDLWRREGVDGTGDRTTARAELVRLSGEVEHWYDDLADSLLARGPVPQPQEHDTASDTRLLDAVRRDLPASENGVGGAGSGDGAVNGTAVRMIWTGDHLDAVRRLQALLVEPATAVTRQR
jgi:uncharacterized membrane protein YccC